MDAINQIIDSYGYESAKAMDLGDSIEVDVSGFMPLVIEKCGENQSRSPTITSREAT